MSVYVDPLSQANARPTRKWPYPEFCHLVADTLPELHAFAKKIGLKSEWFQPSTIPHYDLSPGKRMQAVKFGAEEIDLKKFAELIGKWRAKITGKEKDECTTKQ